MNRIARVGEGNAADYVISPWEVSILHPWHKRPSLNEGRNLHLQQVKYSRHEIDCGAEAFVCPRRYSRHVNQKWEMDELFEKGRVGPP